MAGRILAQDLDGVLVGADRAVGTKAIEDRAGDLGRLDVEAGIVGEAGMADIVVDADGEARLGRGLGQLVQHRLGHGRRELLGGQAVAAADHARHRGHRQGALPRRVGQRREHVQEQGLAERARLLGPVEDRDRLGRGRQGGQEMGGGKRPVQADHDDADPLALGRQMLHGGARGLRARAHQDHDPLGRLVADIVEQAVMAPGQAGELRHGMLDHAGQRRIEWVHGLARLEVDVRILRGATDHRMLGIERAPAMAEDQALVDHGAQLVVLEQRDLVDLVRGPKAVEKMHEGHPAGKRGRLGDQGEIMRLLDRARGEQREAGGAHRHHVLVVAEDREPLGGERTRGDMEDRGRQLAGDLVHVGDHQEQALGGREGGGEGAALEGAMGGTGSAALALHLDDVGHAAEDVRPPLRGPLIGQLGHGRGRRDRVDRADLVQPIGHPGAGLVAVERRHGRAAGRGTCGRHSRRIDQQAAHGAASGTISMAWHGHWS